MVDLKLRHIQTSRLKIEADLLAQIAQLSTGAFQDQARTLATPTHGSRTINAGTAEKEIEYTHRAS